MEGRRGEGKGRRWTRGRKEEEEEEERNYEYRAPWCPAVSRSEVACEIENEIDSEVACESDNEIDLKKNI